MRKGFLVMAFVLSISTMFAQAVGTSKVIVSRGFSPTLNDASKIKRNPSVPDTVYQNPKFNYEIHSVIVESPFKVSKIKAAKMHGEPLAKLYNNYVAGGFGNYTTPFFEFYHSNLRSRDVKYGVHLRHLSSSGSITDYAYPGFSNNLLEAYYTKINKKSMISIDGKYKRDMVHLYGFKPSELDSHIVVPVDDDTRQIYSLGELKLNWKRYRKRPKDMDYNVDMKYHYLSDNYKTAENNVLINTSADWRVNFINALTDQRFGGRINYGFYNNSWDSMTTRNSSLLRVEPYYNFRYRTLFVKASIAADVSMDSVTLVNFYPQLDLKLEAIKKILYFNLTISGGMHKNTLKEYSDENPFISQTIPMDFSNHKYKVNFGLGSTISRELDFNLQLHYNSLEHAPLYVTDYSSTYNNTFKVVYDDYDEVRFRAGFAWQKQDHIRVMLMADYYIYNMTNELFAWHKPQYKLTLSGNYNIGNKILLKAQIFANGASNALVEENKIMVAEKISGYVDANLGIEYRYRKKLGIFLNLNNISASKYYRYYNYPSYRFNAMLGLSYIF
ncbi:MAG: hypothetical protein KAH25_00160 [Bacteroidales bacterium]|nr:hypothetical protein [Bacteroidales bacterium]